MKSKEDVEEEIKVTGKKGRPRKQEEEENSLGKQRD